MHHVHVDTSLDKSRIYEALMPQLKALIESETDTLANDTNIIAAVHHAFNHHWTGLYRVMSQQLVLGVFQGPVACTRIAYGKGVCGTAWASQQIVIVPDVHLFPGHIACSPFSQSEIVVPIVRNDQIIGVLDIDSTRKEAFDEVDAAYLSQIVMFLSCLY